MTQAYKKRRTFGQRALLERLSIIAVVITATIGVGLIGQGLIIKAKPAVERLMSNSVAGSAGDGWLAAGPEDDTDS